MFCLRTRPTNLELDAKNIYYLCIATGIYVGIWVFSFTLERGQCSSATESPVVKIELKTWIGAKLSCSLLVLVPQFSEVHFNQQKQWSIQGGILGRRSLESIYLGTIFLRIGICIWNVDNLDQSSFRSGMLFDWSPEELWCRKLASNLATPAPHLHWWQLMVLFMATSCGRACGQNKDLTAVLIMNWILHSLAISCWGAAGNKVYYLAHE